MKCSNCEGDAGNEYLLVHAVKTDPGAPMQPVETKTVATLCAKCQAHVLTMKLVFQRKKAEKPFSFEQYLAVETDKLP
jgi:hypothetical protein